MKTNVLGRLKEQGFEKLHLSMRDGTLADLSSEKNNGTFQGAAKIIKSERGMSLFLDGASYITVSDSTVFFANENPYSVALWIRPNRLGISQCLWNQWWAGGAGNSAWRLMLNASNYISMENHDGVGASGLTDNTTLISTTSWTFITAVYTGGLAGTNALLYVNGLFARSGTINRAVQNSAYIPTFGRYAADASGYYYGFMDETLYYQNYALNNTEIAQIMAETRPWG